MQTSYSQNMGKAYAGLIADVQFQNNVVSKSLESAIVPPGLIVSRGTDKTLQVVKGGTTPLGVVVRNMQKENNSSGELEYEATDTVGVLTAGIVWVEPINTGLAGAAIYSVDADGTIGIGTAGAGQTQLNGVLEDAVAAGGDLARIKLTEQNN